jgi:hypothetical protein
MPGADPNGAFQLGRPGVRFSDFKDGLSNTFLVGEKHVPLGLFGWKTWDCAIYDGHNWMCSARAAGPGFPLAASVHDLGWKFGSYHPGICQFVMGDGSVRVVSQTTDPVILGLLADRADGLTIPHE